MSGAVPPLPYVYLPPPFRTTQLAVFKDKYIVIVTLFCSVVVLVSASYLPQYEALHREHFLAAGCPHATQLGGPAIKASNVSRSYVLFMLEMETSSPMA